MRAPQRPRPRTPGRVGVGSAEPAEGAPSRWPSAGISTVSALIFAIGAVGVVTRPNPLVILLCLELMLNAGNLALVAFSRMWGREDGQIFALIVMVVAACEVTVGLGLIVAIYRRQLPVNVDDLNELQRACVVTTLGIERVKRA